MKTDRKVQSCRPPWKWSTIGAHEACVSLLMPCVFGIGREQGWVIISAGIHSRVL